MCKVGGTPPRGNLKDKLNSKRKSIPGKDTQETSVTALNPGLPFLPSHQLCTTSKFNFRCSGQQRNIRKRTALKTVYRGENTTQPWRTNVWIQAQLIPPELRPAPGKGNIFSRGSRSTAYSLYYPLASWCLLPLEKKGACELTARLMAPSTEGASGKPHGVRPAEDIRHTTQS